MNFTVPIRGIQRFKAIMTILALTFVNGFCIAAAFLVSFSNVLNSAYTLVILFLLLILVSNLFTKIALIASDLSPANV